MQRDIIQATVKAADEWSVHPAKLMAVVAVESNGLPFETAMPTEKLPRLLFERHVFFRLLPEDRRQAAWKVGLANTTWLPRTQYRDQATSEERVNLLVKAINWWCDPEIPHKSCSWGLFQIMGFNHKTAGFPSAVAMVESFKTLDGQLHGALEFMENTGALGHLRDSNWAKFAKVYNGPSYAKNKYDTRLQLAYEKYREVNA